MFRISINLSSYSYKSTINKSYESFLSQAFADYESIVIDDCSNDDSFSYVKNLTKDDYRITVLRTNKNGGTAVARNAGLRQAKGRYITFLDSNDLLDSNYLEKQLEFIKEHGPLISSGYRRKAKHTCIDFLVPETVDYKTVLRGNPLFV